MAGTKEARDMPIEEYISRNCCHETTRMSAKQLILCWVTFWEGHVFDKNIDNDKANK